MTRSLAAQTLAHTLFGCSVLDLSTKLVDDLTSLSSLIFSIQLFAFLLLFLLKINMPYLPRIESGAVEPLLVGMMSNLLLLNSQSFIGLPTHRS